MNIFEIISAIVLIIACVFIVIVVLMNDSKTGMSQAISGASADSFYQKNSGRTKEAKLNRAMVAATIVFFVLALLVNIINAHIGGVDTEDITSNAGTTSGVGTTVVQTVEADPATAEVDAVVTAEAAAATTEA